MKQTAVEWLEDQYIKENTFLYADDFKKAKEMEKQQIIDFAVWFNNRDNTYKSYTQIVEQYYNETFKK